MHAPGIDNTEAGPPPVRRAVTGVLLGVATGALAAALLPREGRCPEPSVAEATRRALPRQLGAGVPPPPPR